MQKVKVMIYQQLTRVSTDILKDVILLLIGGFIGAAMVILGFAPRLSAVEASQADQGTKNSDIVGRLDDQDDRLEEQSDQIRDQGVKLDVLILYTIPHDQLENLRRQAELLNEPSRALP